MLPAWGVKLGNAIVLDPDGRIFARTDEVNPSRDDLSSEPLVLEAFNSDYGEAYGIWVSRGQLYYTAAVPIGTTKSGFEKSGPRPRKVSGPSELPGGC